MCLNHKEIMASEYSLSIVRDVYLLQAQFVREWLTSPTSVLFCSPSERSPEFHNSSTSASRAARQLGWSLEPDRQGVKLSKDLRSFRITLWHSKRRVTFTTFPIAVLFACFLLVRFSALSETLAGWGGGGVVGQRVPTSPKEGVKPLWSNSELGSGQMLKMWNCEINEKVCQLNLAMWLFTQM